MHLDANYDDTRMYTHQHTFYKIENVEEYILCTSPYNGQKKNKRKIL